jgi:uncharacterized membrane protein YtjA (UPF0391 family)
LTGVIPAFAQAPFRPVGADFVPLEAGFFAFCGPGRVRNFRSKAGLIPHQGAPSPVAPGSKQKVQTEVGTMLSWVVTFLIVALIAGILGFGGIAGASVEIAKIIFFVAVVLFLVSAVVGLARGRTRV